MEDAEAHLLQKKHTFLDDTPPVKISRRAGLNIFPHAGIRHLRALGFPPNVGLLRRIGFKTYIPGSRRCWGANVFVGYPMPVDDISERRLDVSRAAEEGHR